ncbi:glycerophosphodiester phosphodiesterase family protein [Rhizobium leguminosarum]|uniref:glycerophosphodiester phosphodiesterase family protein n=2 Tax=Rhizobium leguminosarum TaxID=384 RepID=UPI0014425E95|nr:glycerophosphodiester phosphodiesterase family protein [Rhizobium leguminosarum]MBY5836298.1 glycerophosphodiester phosphodiesterase family protein [Rhizobium leguminosarum]NKM79010.1 glycerophosphodiester phosphodiesterase [Rhizobium leguminosarum bv. viciae]QSZ08615.1 glycerophosphodiester phosphodiesterase family protein [Rhizobium leguminosarum]
MNYFNYMTDPHRQCAIVAHRGVWQDAPENSLLSIQRAIDAGYDVVEIDVRRTSDGEFVLLHDDTLERMAGLHSEPEQLTLEELTSISLINRDGGTDNAVTDQKLPGLRDVFELTRDKIFIHLDIKHRHVIPEVLAYAQKMGVDQQVDFWADLKTEDDFVWIKDNIAFHDVPFIARTHLEHDDADEQVELVFRLKPLICEVSFKDIAQVEAIRQRFHDAGITLWVNTLDGVASPGFTDTAALKDPDAIWGRLLRAGFSAVQTDEMEKLRAYIAAHQPVTARTRAFV